MRSPNRHPLFKFEIVREAQEKCSCNSSFPSYICLSCHALFCRDCARLVGIPSACVCQACGSLCSDYSKFLQKQTILADKTAPYNFEDLKAALRFPLQDFSTNFGLGLIYGALLFAVPYLALSGVGIFFALAGVIPAFVAIGLLFGCNLRVIEAVEAGRVESKNPLDASEMLADLGETVALSCGILLVALMPYLMSLLFTPNV